MTFKEKPEEKTMDKVKKADAAAVENESKASAQAAEKPYFAGIDIVKILALILVVCIHFYLYNGFYYFSITNSSAIGPIAFRWVAYSCVPLFMISTGYLMKNKTFSAKFYAGLIRIIAIYVIISIICIKFKEHHFHEVFTPWKILKGYLEFNNAQYGWYINYYIAIFLIIPFLNLAINGCKTSWQKFFLVAATVFITIFARSFYLGFNQNDQIKAVPDYLEGAWPIAYYLTGAFIRDCHPKRNVRNKLMILAAFALSLSFLTYSSYKHTLSNDVNDNFFLSRHFNQYGAYPVYAVAVCIFLMLFDITTKNKGVKFVLRQLSGLTLGTYLISYIFDNMFYNGWRLSENSTHHEGFNQKYIEVGDRFAHWYEIIPKVFICSLICGFLIHKLYDLCTFLVKKVAAILKSKTSGEATKTKK